MMLDARDSIRRAWAAVSDRLPSEMPAFHLPKLPELHLPKLKLPTLPSMPEMPAMPSMAALGRFLSGLSISTLVFAPGQLQGIAAFCHFAAGDLAPQPDVPRVEQITPDMHGRSMAQWSASRLNPVAGVALRIEAPKAWQPSVLDFSESANAMPPQAPAPAAVVALVQNWPEPRVGFSSVVWSEACERGQRPPPVLA